MADKKWTNVNGVSNLDEVDSNIYARLNAGNNTEVTYLAYGGLRIVELAGNIEFGETDEHRKEFDEFFSQHSDVEVILPIKTKTGVAFIGINDMDEVVSDQDVTTCVSTVTVDGDELGDYDDESGVMELFGMDC